MSSVELSDLADQWRNLAFTEFTSLALRLGGVSSESVNSAICHASDSEAKLESTLRLIIALHFQLGKRAEFLLNDIATAELLDLIKRGSAGQRASGSVPSSFPTIAALSVILLSLNAASHTIGVENQLCAEFLSITPEQQKLFLPLVHRSFYSWLRRNSLSAPSFNGLVSRQALEPRFHPQLRLFALAHSSNRVIEEFIETQLLNADVQGPKPIFGSAPSAIGVDGRPAKIFTVLHRYEGKPLPSQIHHCYLVGAIHAFIQQELRMLGGLSSLSHDSCTVLLQYVSELFVQLAHVCTAPKVPPFSQGKQIGLVYIEAVAVEAIALAASICRTHPLLAPNITGDVTAFFYQALKASRCEQTPKKSEVDELPELHESATIEIGDSGEPLFGPEVILAALEFQCFAAPKEEFLNFFGDIVSSRFWNSYLLHNNSFPLQFCLMLLHNTSQLSDLLPKLGPRVMWLLAHSPHALFPVVRRLIPHLFSNATSLDLFFRIVFLPVLCYANENSPLPSGDDSVDRFLSHLWEAIESWDVDPALSSSTALAHFCLSHKSSADLWDGLHQQLARGQFTQKMLCGYRLIRPLLIEFCNCSPLPEGIFDGILLSYFFLVSPKEGRCCTTDIVLEIGRRIAEDNPTLVMRAVPTFLEAVQQYFLPGPSRSWEMQRWAAVIVASALSTSEGFQAEKDAGVLFEIVHELLWELTAQASTEVTDMGNIEEVFGSEVQRLATTSFTLQDGKQLGMMNLQLATDFLPEYAVIVPPGQTWTDAAKEVWVAEATPSRLHGVEFTQHMHALVISLTLLARKYKNLRERGIICLANIVRTLTRSPRSGTGLVATASMCVKLLRYPPMSGIETMPLHALLGVHVK